MPSPVRIEASRSGLARRARRVLSAPALIAALLAGGCAAGGTAGIDGGRPGPSVELIPTPAPTPMDAGANPADGDTDATVSPDADEPPPSDVEPRLEPPATSPLSSESLSIRYVDVPTARMPFLALYTSAASEPSARHDIPFAASEERASGRYEFGEQPAGTYLVRLVYADEGEIAAEVAIEVLADGDGDGVQDALDGCPQDPNKPEPGSCGCGVADVDEDGDDVADCLDECPNQSLKSVAGACGCDTPDTDTDGDGTADCEDLCASDPAKTDPGECGCGQADADGDEDGTLNCNELCPEDPNKLDPGSCGCGNLEPFDDPDFVDAKGFRCDEWVGYDCTEAEEVWRYTAAEEQRILDRCSATCGVCPGAS